MGTSGLSVSRLALGTMTWGRTTDEEGAREQLRTFLDAGGTLVDTAHGYSDGASEEIKARFGGRTFREEGSPVDQAATPAGAGMAGGYL